MTGRPIKFDWLVKTCSGRADMIVRCPGRGISVSNEELDHVFGLLYLCEIENS